ncbi:MAG TPA: class I SAM-dependent methyltransferase, partial [Candidatus Angelobacter sp.]
MTAPAGQATERFQFGENWTRFLSLVDEDRITEACGRLAEIVGDIGGKFFLDAGSGSGIHSLAAIRLGAARVLSFDYDPKSVACTAEMKRRFAPMANWQVEAGSALDEQYLRSLGQFDVVYSWGVLHHTGAMWKGLELITIPAKERLVICLYADQGAVSRLWRFLKRCYVSYPYCRPAVTVASLMTLW